MQPKTQAFGASSPVSPISDIKSIKWDGSQLAIRLAISRSGELINGLDVDFQNIRSFRVLDESDLARYWSSTYFVRESHVLKVIAGGWRDGEAALQGFPLYVDECLVVTGNTCVSVFSISVPLIKNPIGCGRIDVSSRSSNDGWETTFGHKRILKMNESSMQSIYSA